MSRHGSQAGAFVAILCLFAGGLAYRAATAHLSSSSESAPLPPDALNGLPWTIGDWDGHDVPMADEIVAATDADQILSRGYNRNRVGRPEKVSLYIAYGLRIRDMMPHRPEVCYVSNGWTRASAEQVEIVTETGTKIPCRVLEFQSGVLSAERITVLNFYIVNGEVAPDVDALRWGRAWRRPAESDYSAQVQITCSAASAAAADQIVRAFAADSADSVLDLFPDTGATREKQGPTAINDPDKPVSPRRAR